MLDSGLNLIHHLLKIYCSDFLKLPPRVKYTLEYLVMPGMSFTPKVFHKTEISHENFL